MKVATTTTVIHNEMNRAALPSERSTDFWFRRKLKCKFNGFYLLKRRIKSGGCCRIQINGGTSCSLPSNCRFLGRALTQFKDSLCQISMETSLGVGETQTIDRLIIYTPFQYGYTRFTGRLFPHVTVAHLGWPIVVAKVLSILG